jgi:hypothetical protein
MLRVFVSSNCRHWARIVVFLYLTLLPDLPAACQVVAKGDSNLPPDPASINLDASGNSSRFEIRYTGALFGYYRIEPDASEASLDPPKLFVNQNPDPSFLLGMGDNFGPEFGASVQRELPKGAPCNQPIDAFRTGLDKLAPESLYKDEDRLPVKADCDNVTRFLMRAGYRAIVPGKEDFLYSARWLRRIAVLLHGAAATDPPPDTFPELFEDKLPKGFTFISDPGKDTFQYRPLMLAANLRVNFTAKITGLDLPADIKKQALRNQPKSDGYSICPLFFAWDPLQFPETCVSGGDRGDTVTTQMDWLRRLDATTPRGDCNLPSTRQEPCFPVADSMNLQARKDVTFRRQLLENEAQIVIATLRQFPEDQVGSLKAALGALSKDTAFHKLENRSVPLSLSPEGTKQLDGLRTWVANQGSKVDEDLYQLVAALQVTLQQLSDVATQSEKNFLFPPDARGAAVELLLEAIAKEQENVGYTISEGTLVIGVVGQETMQAVSPPNLQLCTKWTPELAKPAITRNFAPCDEGHRNLEGVRAAEPLIAKGRLVGEVEVGDPILAVTTVLRAVWGRKRVARDKKNDFNKVVVMAQMPYAEAEELSAHILSTLKKTGDYGSSAAPQGNNCKDASTEDPYVDLILSEAQPGHTSPDLELHYSRGCLIPVVAPKPAWYIQGRTLVEPVSNVTVTTEFNGKRILTILVPPEDDTEPAKLQTMAELLFDQLSQTASTKPSIDLANLNNLWNSCNHGKACEETVMTQYLLEQICRRSHADVVFLQYRDFYFGDLIDGYGQDDVCPTWVKDHPTDRVPGVSDPEAYCHLHVALDRVIWGGDVSERVMVNGQTLTSMLATAQKESDDEQTLVTRDTTRQWLTTFGITTELPKNLSAASMGPATFTVPGITLCQKDQKDAKGAQYCINARPIADDGAYWVATSDHLARDSQLYKDLSNLDPKYHLKKPGLFLTREITDEVYVRSSKGASEALVSASDSQSGMRQIETYQQKRPILQLDYAKVVAGVMLRKPDMINTNLATNFSGVADSRATTPSAQEVDFEALERMTRGLGVQNFWQYLKAGVQADLEYDRAVTGNITGSPETVTYALNSFTTGGFLQVRLNRDTPTRRLFLVIAPYQYQQQLVGNYLYFKFAAPPGQITVSTPKWNGFVQRFGTRYEFGGSFAGSYLETGPEYSEIHNILSGLVLPGGEECPVTGGSFTSCFSRNNLVITSSTVLKPLTETVRSGGWYWDVHVQRALDKGKHFSFTVETKGDDYAWPGITLPTQSRYAFTTTGALNFAVIGNLTFSPTFTTFFYSNQGAPANPSHSLVTDTFSVTAKWYFARDAAVPFWQQMWFRGPASSDQTKGAKMK